MILHVFTILCVLLSLQNTEKNPNTKIAIPDLRTQRQIFNYIEEYDDNNYIFNSVYSLYPSDPTEKTFNKSSNEKNKDGTEYWPPFLGVRLKITDSLLALFTLFLVFFTGLLWRSTEKLWAAGERQITIARQAADAAKLSADAALSIVESDRAWMTFDRVEFIKVNNSNVEGKFYKDTVAIQAVFSNKGRSPAIGAFTVSFHQVVAVDERKVPHIPIKFPPEIEGGAPVGSGVEARGTCVFLEDSEYQKLMDTKVAIVFYSAMQYSTIYSPERRKETQTCHRIYFPGMRFTNDGQKSENWQIQAAGTQNKAT